MEELINTEDTQRVPTEKDKQSYKKNMKEQNELLKLQSDQWEYTYKIYYYKAAVANMEADLANAKEMALSKMAEAEPELELEPVTGETVS